jgi:hypothetical protein
MLEAKPLPDDEFTYKCITGKRRRNKGTWYGLVEPMKDPQRWANKFFSEILFVLRTNANGGLIIEEDAVEDTEKFEADFAKADTNVYVPPGTVSGGQADAQAAGALSAGHGQADGGRQRGDPDDVGHQPRNAGHGRPRTGRRARAAAQAGRVRHPRRLLRQHPPLSEAAGPADAEVHQQVRPEGTLVRIVPKDGTAQFVPLAKSPDTAEFDVIVDEAPMGPNQKQAVWAMFMQMFQMMKGQMPPDIIAEFLRYAPFPAATAEKLSQAVQARAQPDPMQQQLQVRGATAKVAGDEADARKKNAEAQRTEAETVAMAHGVDDARPRAGLTLRRGRTPGNQT